MSEQKELKSFDDFIKLFEKLQEMFLIPGNKFSFTVDVSRPKDYAFLESKLESRIKELEDFIEANEKERIGHDHGIGVYKIKIDALEEENKRFREALTEVMKVSGSSCLHYVIAAKALSHKKHE